MVFSESPGFSIALLPATASLSPGAKMTMRTCSHCGNSCHNSRNCSESAGGFMLFGVRLTGNSTAAGGSPPFRKSASMTSLAHYDRHRQDSNADLAAGYASDDAGKCRERRRGVPWTEDEHRLFLLGLKTVGKGDWRGISRNFVKTRTPTQVASHAQKYFLRRSGANRRRRRSSLFDITADTLTNPSSEEHLQSKPPPSLQMNLSSSKMADLNLNEFPPAIPAAPASEGESPARFCGNRENAISVA